MTDQITKKIEDWKMQDLENAFPALRFDPSFSRSSESCIVQVLLCIFNRLRAIVICMLFSVALKHL